jgi:hypothetical protein
VDARPVTLVARTGRLPVQTAAFTRPKPSSRGTTAACTTRYRLTMPVGHSSRLTRRTVGCSSASLRAAYARVTARSSRLPAGHRCSTLTTAPARTPASKPVKEMWLLTTGRTSAAVAGSGATPSAAGCRGPPTA